MSDNQISREAISNALQMREEIAGFSARWPTPSSSACQVPAISWDQLTRQLADLATTPAKRSMASALVSATRKQAIFKPAEMVIREILCIASVLMDETFDPEFMEEDGMT